MPVKIEQPYPVFRDKIGFPLDGGLIYIGVSGLNPETNPIQCYFDEDFTLLAPQPLRTINGYISRNGSPANVFLKVAECSITIKDRFRITQYTSLNYQLSNFGVLTASSIFEDSGLSQQQINDSSIKFYKTHDLLLAQTNFKDGQLAYVYELGQYFEFKSLEWKAVIVNEVNLNSFPKLDADIDDTERFLRAAAAIEQIQASSPPSGVTSVTTTVLYIPFGEYSISSAITINPYVHVISNEMPTIKQTTAATDIFVFNESYSNVVSGIRFFNGKNPIVFKNSNLDQTVLKVDNCEFHRSESYAIYTLGLTETQHMSAFIDIANCKFSLCNKVFHNVCDKALLRNSWAYLYLNNFSPDSAAIMNMQGQLSIDSLLGVPNLGSPNPFWGTTSRVPNTRWIDNYGVLNCFRCRFGLEGDGLTIVHSFGGAKDLSQGMGSTITLKECQISGGDKTWLGDGETGVIRIRAKMPKKIVVEDCNFQYNTPLIVLNQNYDFIGYLNTLVDNPSKLGKYLRDNIVISAKNNEKNSTVEIIDIPSILSQFVNGGSGLTPHKVTISGTDTYFSYNMPIGGNGALYEFDISGNTNPDGSSLYSYSMKYNLLIGTGFDGTQIAFYTQGVKLPMGTTPAGISISGNNMDVSNQFFGDGLTGSNITPNNGSNAERYITIKVSNSKNIEVKANLNRIN